MVLPWATLVLPHEEGKLKLSQVKGSFRNPSKNPRKSCKCFQFAHVSTASSISFVSFKSKWQLCISSRLSLCLTVERGQSGSKSPWNGAVIHLIGFPASRVLKAMSWPIMAPISHIPAALFRHFGHCQLHYLAQRCQHSYCLQPVIKFNVKSPTSSAVWTNQLMDGG